ncbi:nuclear factor NF-kappa-B p105 subunit [Tachysurus ichikawai]
MTEDDPYLPVTQEYFDFDQPWITIDQNFSTLPISNQHRIVKLDWRRFSARFERMWSEPSHCSTQEEEAEASTATRTRQVFRQKAQARSCSQVHMGGKLVHTLMIGASW